MGEMKFARCILVAAFVLLVFQYAKSAPAQDLNSDERNSTQVSEPVLELAVMCETIEAFAPKNPAVVFSISIGEVLCYSAFKQVPREMAIYHKWYRKDVLNTSRKLTLKPPRWSTFSRIQFREADKGPWRVDITDETGTVLSSLRFSIAD
jgi:hypothetical protein